MGGKDKLYKMVTNKGPVHFKLDLSHFLEDYSIKDTQNKLYELISTGQEITAYTEESILDRYKSNKPYFHQDFRRMYLKWKSTARRLLEIHKKYLLDEFEKFSRTDSVPVTNLEEDLLVSEEEGQQWVKNIREETYKKLDILQEVRKKVGKHPSKFKLVTKEIKFITVVEYTKDRGDKFIYLVNDDYSIKPPLTAPFKGLSGKINKSGRLLYDISKSPHRLAVDDYGNQAHKYWNLNKDNPMYARAGFLLKDVIKLENGEYKFLIKIKRIGNGTYEKNLSKFQ